MCQSSAPSASTDSSESALGTPSPHTPRSHVSPLETPPPPAANNAALSHLTRPHARRDAHPRSTQPPRAPRSPRASRTARPGPCAAHAATAVSHFVTSQTAQPHRPPPLPDVQHGRRPAKPAPITPLHPLPPAHPAEPAPHTHSGAHLAAGCQSASAPLLLRGPSTATSFVPRLREGPPTPAAARHSAALHQPGPLQRLGCPPQRPRRPWGGAARCARHLRNRHARLNRHHRWPRCGAPKSDLPEPRRWKVAAGVGRGARVATSGVRALLGLPSAKDVTAGYCERILSCWRASIRRNLVLRYFWVGLPTFLGLFVGTTFARAP